MTTEHKPEADPLLQTHVPTAMLDEARALLAISEKAIVELARERDAMREIIAAQAKDLHEAQARNGILAQKLVQQADERQSIMRYAHMALRAAERNRQSMLLAQAALSMPMRLVWHALRKRRLYIIPQQHEACNMPQAASPEHPAALAA